MRQNSIYFGIKWGKRIKFLSMIGCDIPKVVFKYLRGTRILQ